MHKKLCLQFLIQQYFIHILTNLIVERKTLKLRKRSNKVFGPVGRAVASENKGPSFESSQWKILQIGACCQLY